MIYYKERKNYKPLYVIFFIASCLLSFHFGMLRGKVKQMEKGECLKHAVAERINKMASLSEEICVNAKKQSDDFDDERIVVAEKEIKRWKDNYFWLKKQNDEKTEN